MNTLSTALAELAARHESSPEQDFDALFAEVKVLAGHPLATGHEYRHNLGWDRTWMDLDPPSWRPSFGWGNRVSGAGSLAAGNYTGGRELPEPEFGMFPIDATDGGTPRNRAGPSAHRCLRSGLQGHAFGA